MKTNSIASLQDERRGLILSMATYSQEQAHSRSATVPDAVHSHRVSQTMILALTLSRTYRMHARSTPLRGSGFGVQMAEMSS